MRIKIVSVIAVLVGIACGFFVPSSIAKAVDPVNIAVVMAQNPKAWDMAVAGGSAGTAAADTLEESADRIIGPMIGVILREVLLNTLSYVSNKLAYDAAVALASGATGQTPLIESTTPEEYFRDLGMDVLGNAIGVLGDSVGNALDVQFDICAPQDQLPRLGLQIGLRSAYAPPALEPRCDFREFMDNMNRIIGTYTGTEGGTQNILRRFAMAYEPGQTELSASIEFSFKLQQSILETKEIGIKESWSNEGYKDVVDAITGQIKTPASLLKKQTESVIVDEPRETNRQRIDIATQDKEAFKEMGLSVASVFLNTFLSNLANNIFSGLFTTPTHRIDPFSPISALPSGREKARETYRNILSPAILSFDTYSAMGEFIVCPGEGMRGLNNCVMDQEFASAVSRANTGEPMTVQEAIDEGFLDGDKPLISSRDEGRNQDPSCYTYGYCYGNLVKIRKARVIPIGWEMAADSPFNDQASPVTLQTVIDGFFNCNDNRQADASHPWCHLIDPNWILKTPPSQCKAFMPIELPVSGMINARQSACIDSPNCLSQDNEGNCVGGYGYCTEEKNTWRFSGDSCPAEYAGCLAFSNTRTGESGNYLINTVNTVGCSADNAGCMWYRTNKYLDDKGNTDSSDDSFEFLPTGEEYDVAAMDALVGVGELDSSALYAYEDRIYVNQNVGVCSAESVGCAELIDASNVSLNMIENPSFENDADSDEQPDGWTDMGPISISSYDTTTGSGHVGTDAITVPATVSQSNITLSSNRFYTLSFYAKGGASSNVLSIVELTPENPANTVNLLNSTVLGDCSKTANTVSVSTGALESGYERFTCTFTTPSFETRALLSISLSGAGTYLDAVQLELGSVASSFHDAYGSGSIARSYLKVAPDWLGCTGTSSDPEECAAYTQMCSAQDVGCEMYTPSAGGFGVPAVISAADSCPAECVGYETYRQEATNYESEDFPLYFIAESAQMCSQADVGCDEYTNLDDVARGGEGLEYYSDIKFCATSRQDEGETFYTWEGTETEGFQLRTWRLMESNLSDSLDSVYSETRNANLVQVFVEQNVGKAPCTSSSVSADDNDVICNDAPRVAIENDTFTYCNEHEDIFTNPDCREFYDDEGNIHYRLMSETVVISDDCAPYRKNVSDELNCENSGGHWTTGGTCRYFILASESDSCLASAAGCRNYTGGSGRNASTIFTDTVEDGSLNEYDGLNSSVSISSESIAAGGHSIRFTNGFLNTLSLVEGGSGVTVSINGTPTTDGQCDAGNVCTLEDAGGASCTVSGTDVDNSDDCGALVDKLLSGKTYVLEFWARGTGNMIASLTEDRGDGPTRYFAEEENPLIPEIVEVTSGWQLYSLGPLNTAGLTDFDDTAVLSFEIDSSSSDIYIDNITLKETEENLTLIKDSWVTPSVCDQSATGMPSPQNYLGCQEYTDSTSVVHDLYRFTRLCGENVIGCEAFYDTQNSESVFGQVFNATCSFASAVTNPVPCMNGSETVCTVQPGKSECFFNLDGSLPDPLPANISLGPEARVVTNDRDIFLVNKGGTSCSVSNAGCMEVGRPVFNQTKAFVTGFEPYYVIDEPDQYQRTLCDSDGLFCEAWSTGQDGTFYFKNPDTQTCEHKNSVSINNQEYSGWFRTGTNSPCYYDDVNENGQFDATDNEEMESAYLIGGTEFGIWRNGDVEDYAGWVAQCSDTYDRCSDFIDPMDTSDGLYPGGTPYVYIKNEKLEDESQSSGRSCNGQVSLDAGCAMFFDSIQPELLWNASASYIASEHADILFGDAAQSLRSPMSCNGAEAGSENDVGQIITPSGTKLNLCQQRCEYVVDAGVSISHPYADAVAENSAVDAPRHVYTTSCVQDSDCPILEDSNHNRVGGVCVQSFEDSPQGIQVQYRKLMGDAGAILNFNDVNDVRKVSRDRECSEWITCSSTIPVWDELIGRYKTVCDQIGSCVENGDSQDVTICTEFSDVRPAALTEDLYSSRDVSWWGTDNSGFSIPNAIQAQFLDQVNINPQKWCADILDEDGNGIPCTEATEETDCAIDADTSAACVGAPTDYRLAFTAGTCDSANLSPGDACYVGRCENSGYDCSFDGECDTTLGEQCLIGTCVSTKKNAFCSSDADCAAHPGFATCDGGVCKALNTGICGPLTENLDCGSDTTAVDNQCVTVDTSFIGTCWSDRCLLGVDNTPFSPDLTQDNQNAIECRGYPEQNSPFQHTVNGISTGLVTQWKSFDADSETVLGPVSTSDDAIPYTQLPGYQGAEICAPGNECMCSYQKISYGDGVKYRYYDKNEDEHLTGICFGGDYEGAECINDNGCNSDEASVSTGRCLKPTSIETMLGLQGYCLERDTTMNRFSNANNLFGGQCLTWLPLDQLAGADDIYNQSTEAGMLLNEDALYCTNVDLYYDLYVTNSTNPGYENNTIAEDDVACAESKRSGNGANCAKGQTDGCWENAHCPVGYFAIVGECLEDIYGDACAQTGGKDNDCPYICVPEDAVDPYNLDDDVRCAEPDGVGYHQTTSGYPIYVGGLWIVVEPNTTYLPSNGLSGDSGYGTWIDRYATCVRRGVHYEDDDTYERLGIAHSNHSKYGFRNVGNGAAYYLGCSEIAVASDVSGLTGETAGGNKAWTDRLWSGKPESEGGVYSIYASDDPHPLSYTTLSIPTDYAGRIEGGLLEMVDAGLQMVEDPSFAADQFPVPVFACENSSGHIYVPTTTTGDKVCADDDTETEYYPSTEPIARSYEYAAYSSGRPQTNECPNGDVDCNPDVSCNMNAACSVECSEDSDCEFDTDDDGSIDVNLGDCNEDTELCETALYVGGDCSDDSYTEQQIPGQTDSGTCVSGESAGNYCIANEDCYSNICEDWGGDKSQCVSSAGNSSGPSVVDGADDSSESFEERLAQMFVKVFGYFSYLPFDGENDGEYQLLAELEGDDFAEDPDGVPGPNDAGEPPTVYALGDCFSAGCREGAMNEITVNGVDGGTIEGEQGGAHIAVQFFAAADPNQMPIRNVIVDWGDGSLQSGSSSESNYYKNRRGLLNDSQTNSICDRGNAWGETSESCVPGYFTFTHDYTCTTQKVSDTGLPECSSSSADLSNGCQSEDECVFVPRVYVKDNWGYCTGECGDVGSPAGAVCYDNSEADMSNYNECDTDCDVDSSSPSCDANDYIVNVNPWISFDGEVRITP